MYNTTKRKDVGMMIPTSPYSIAQTTLLLNRSILLQPYVRFSLVCYLSLQKSTFL